MQTASRVEDRALARRALQPLGIDGGYGRLWRSSQQLVGEEADLWLLPLATTYQSVHESIPPFAAISVLDIDKLDLSPIG